MYTHSLSMYVDTPAGAVPGSRVLALDGRNRSHLAHANISKHIPGATGNLFWVVGRTSDRNQANLFLEHCGIYAPGQIHVALPCGVQKVKMNKTQMPQVPILVNKRVVPGNTMLVAHDDPVVAKAKEEERMSKKAKVEGGSAQKEGKKPLAD